VRGFLFGLVVIVFLTGTILAIRPGGFKRQLRLAGRRFRIMLVLGGVFVFGSLALRLAFPEGPVADFGPAVLAVGLAVGFVIWGRDPADIGSAGGL
jgi:hypothetical protein